MHCIHSIFLNPADWLRDLTLEADMTADTLANHATVTETTVTIKLTSPVAGTVKRQVEQIMEHVDSAKRCGQRRTNILDREHAGIFAALEDIHPETIALLNSAEMRIEPEYEQHAPKLGGNHVASKKLTAIYVVW